MNIEEFTIKYATFKDADYIEIQCDHPNHEPKNEIIPIKKQAAKRNILKRSGKQFICGNCCMKYNNPMNHVGERRQTDEMIKIFCPDPLHKGDPFREVKKSGYFGPMEEPYTQICGSCVQRGKIMSEEQKDAISKTLKGVKKSDEFKNNLSDYMKNNPEGIARATKNILDNPCRTGMLGKTHSDETKKQMSESHMGKKFTPEHCANISIGRKKMLQETGGFSDETLRKLREAANRQYENGFNPNNYHICGYHQSNKAGLIFHKSSYEKKAFLILDEDNEVKTYWIEKLKIPYIDLDSKEHIYIVDLIVEFVDGSITYIEVKPFKMTHDATNIIKAQALHIYAESMGHTSTTWSEIQLFGPVYNQKNIDNFVMQLKAEIECQKGNPTTLEQIKEEKKAKRKARREEKKIIVKYFCEYCKTDHETTKKTYDKNIIEFGKMICPIEHGAINGAKPKKPREKKEITEKQCKGKCGKIKPIEEFSKGKATCMQCRAENYKKKYQNKEKENNNE